MSRTCSLSPRPHQQQVQQSYSDDSTSSLASTSTRSVCTIPPPSRETNFTMCLKAARQQGQMVLVLHHSSMQSKQNSCWQGRVPRVAWQRLRQMGHMDQYLQPYLLVISAVFYRCFFMETVISVLGGVRSAASSIEFVSSIRHSWSSSSDESYRICFMVTFLRKRRVEGVELTSLGEVMRALLRDELEQISV